MATLNPNTWYRASIKPYLTKIKVYIAAQIAAAITPLDTRITALESITGAYKGSFTTVAAMPTGSGTKTGDWAILSVDDGANESGIWVKAAAGWQFALDVPAFAEIRQELLATDAEALAGTSAAKVMTVLQTVTRITSALAAKADVGGNATQAFLAADAQEGTKQAVNASQFAGAVTPAEAQTDWDAA